MSTPVLSTPDPSLQARALRHASLTEALSRQEKPGKGGRELAERLRWPLLREAIHLIDEGATPLQVDRALVRFGFTAAPLAAMDQQGLAAFADIGPDAGPALPMWRLRYSPTLDLMLDAGRGGAVSGKGWYRYGADGRNPREDPELEELLRDSSHAQRLRRLPLADSVIVERCLQAMLTAAEALIRDGSARDVEIDAASTRWLGFPRRRGGLLYHAARVAV